MTARVYLDHAATAPLRPEAREAMLAWLGPPANPASAHGAGRAAAAAVDRAREAIAHSVGADPRDVVFTSGATEANHLAVRGLMPAGGRLALGAVEHPCVQAAARAADADRIVWPVSEDGVVQAGKPADLASVQAVNHESGVVQPVPDRAVAGRVHVDAVQAMLTREVALHDGLDALTLSAHKLGGPAGVGALVLARGVEPTPLFAGSQERGRRGGTPSVSAIAGFAAAVEATVRQRASLRTRAAAWQARLEAALAAEGVRIAGAGVPRVPTHTLAVVDVVPGEAVVAALDLAGVAVSVGSACASGSGRPSPVLKAMGDPSPAGAVRLTTGWSTTDADIDHAVSVLPAVLGRIREAFG